jgi:hypothetical protein
VLNCCIELAVLNDPIDISFEKLEYDFKKTEIALCLKILQQIYGSNHFSTGLLEGYDAWMLVTLS